MNSYLFILSQLKIKQNQMSTTFSYLYLYSRHRNNQSDDDGRANFSLSTPLRSVVSAELVSASIPVSWYAIAQIKIHLNWHIVAVQQPLRLLKACIRWQLLPQLCKVRSTLPILLLPFKPQRIGCYSHSMLCFLWSCHMTNLHPCSAFKKTSRWHHKTMSFALLECLNCYHPMWAYALNN